jgi:UTP:GlnB (protein PII) uridylyltransferase
MKEGCTSTLHLQLTLPKAGPNGKKKLVKFDFEVGEDTAFSVADEMSDALGLNSGERDEVSAKIDYRVKSVIKEGGDGSRSRLKRSKSHAALVRVPVAIGDSMGVTVVRNPDNENQFRIDFCVKDRSNLLWELTNSLHDLPLRVTNASICTTNEGVAMDAFDVVLEDDADMTPSQIQEHLERIINPKQASA